VIAAGEFVAPAAILFSPVNHATQTIKQAAMAMANARAERFEPLTPADEREFRSCG
jgi:phosphohistidine phosphatase SixA